MWRLRVLGIAEGAFEIAKEYLKTREQFGKPLFKNQYLAFKMAELECEIEAAKWVLYKAAIDKQEGRPYSIPAARGKISLYRSSNACDHRSGSDAWRKWLYERISR